MTLAEYLDNPLGKGDSSLPNRTMIIAGLNAKYNSLIQRKEKDFSIKVYQNPYASEVLFHIIIPSETDRDNTYDVLFLLSDLTRTHKHDLSVRNYEVQMFANTPSFAFTFAYVYRQYGLLIPLFEPKLGKEFLTTPPSVRNKFEIVSYDKYLFFGAKYLLDSKWYLNRAYLDTHSYPYKPAKILKEVRTLQTILKQYDEAAAKIRKDKKYQKNESKRKMGTGSVGVDVGTTRKPMSSTVSKASKIKKPKPKLTSVKTNRRKVPKR